MAQSNISRTLRTEGSLSRISSILSQEQFASRRDLGRRICEVFRFINPMGQPQLTGCMKALSDLAATKTIVLPPPCRAAGDSAPRQFDGDVSPPVGVPSRLSEITDLEVMVVNGKERPLWNTLATDGTAQGSRQSCPTCRPSRGISRTETRSGAWPSDGLERLQQTDKCHAGALNRSPGIPTPSPESAPTRCCPV